MKKKIFTLTILLLSFCIVTTKTFAQRDAGGSASGDTGTGTVADPGTPDPGVPQPLVIDLGAAGEITIPTTSPFYSILSSFLTTCHETGDEVSTPCGHTSCQLKNLSTLFFTGCINYRTLGTCKSAPSTCNTVPKRSCHHW